MERQFRGLSQIHRDTRCIVRVERDSAFEERLERADRAVVVFNTGADEVDILRVHRDLGFVSIRCSNGHVMNLDINGLVEGRTIKLGVPSSDKDPTHIEREGRRISRLHLRAIKELAAAQMIVSFIKRAAARISLNRLRSNRIASSVDTKLLALAESIALITDANQYGAINVFETSTLIPALLHRAGELIVRASRLVSRVELSLDAMLSPRDLHVVSQFEQDSSLRHLKESQKDRHLPNNADMHGAILGVASDLGRLCRPLLGGFFDVHSTFESEIAELPPTKALPKADTIFDMRKDTFSIAALRPLLAFISESASPLTQTAAFKSRVLTGVPPLVYNLGCIYSSAFDGGPFRFLTDELLLHKLSEGEIEQLREIRYFTATATPQVSFQHSHLRRLFVVAPNSVLDQLHWEEGDRDACCCRLSSKNVFVATILSRLRLACVPQCVWMTTLARGLEASALKL